MKIIILFIMKIRPRKKYFLKDIMTLIYNSDYKYMHQNDTLAIFKFFPIKSLASNIFVLKLVIRIN